MPRYRLLTPNEWKVAAVAQGDENYEYVVTSKEYLSKKDFEKSGMSYLKGDKRRIHNEYLSWSVGPGRIAAVNNSHLNNYLICINKYCKINYLIYKK